MSLYDDSFRQEVVALRDEVFTDLQAAGLIMARWPVHLVTVTTTGADPAAGDPGTTTETLTELVPRPRVDMREQWRTRDGARVQVGDAALVISQGACTRAHLEAAAALDIAGDRYTLAPGELKDRPFSFEVVVARVRP